MSKQRKDKRGYSANRNGKRKDVARLETLGDEHMLQAEGGKDKGMPLRTGSSHQEGQYNKQNDNVKNRPTQNERTEDIGNRSQNGTTSTDYYKSTLQKTDREEENVDPKRMGVDSKKGMEDNRTGIGPDENDIVDAGYTRTAAFSKGNDPRTPESLKNRGATQGSDDGPHQHSE